MFKDKVIHFIGIGGISMSGIAQMVKNMGAKVTGSDIKENEMTKKLQQDGIDITIGSDKEKVKKASIIVYSSAINENDPELKLAKYYQKEIYERAKFLGLLMTNYEEVICISGTHGKSTTTGMISSCFLQSFNPTIQIGANFPLINGNYHIGDNKYFIVEACEYVDSFLSFHPTSAVVLNIDDDHLDYFKDINNTKKSFNKFINLLPPLGKLVINNDCDKIKELNLPHNLTILTYGIDNDASLKAKNITFDSQGYPEFDIYYNKEFFLHLELKILGIHNIYNALAATGIGILYDLDKEDIKSGLNNYLGVERRLEYIGKIQNNITIYDDYAHHPEEIKATLKALQKLKYHQNFVIFQSHTYSRTKEHLEEFANILACFDNVIIAPIYGAREKNIYNVKEEDLVNLIKPFNQNVWALSFDEIIPFLETKIEENDLILTMGAGPINTIGLELLKKI